MKIEITNLSFHSSSATIDSPLSFPEGIHCLCSHSPSILQQLFQYLTASAAPPSGQVRFLNYEVCKLGEAYRNHLSYFGRYPLFPDTFPLFHYLIYTSVLQRLPPAAARQKADDLIQKMKLEAFKASPLSELHPDLLKRIDLYQTILSEAPILILEDRYFPAKASPDYKEMLSILSKAAESKIIIILHPILSHDKALTNDTAQKEEDPLPDLPHRTYVISC